MDTIIHETTNYDLFEPFEVNRNVNKNSKRYRKLRDSIKDNGFLAAYPLHCRANGSGTLKIVSGHHRFEAAKDLGTSVKYVVINDDISVYDLEQAGPGKWRNQDYLDSYAKLGYEDYCYLKDYMARTGIGLTNAASMLYGGLAGSGNFTDNGRFAKGWFKIKDFNRPKVVGDIVLFLKKNGIKWASNSLFVKALSRMVILDEFDSVIFKDKICTYPYVLKKQRNLEDYLKNIEEVYNYKTQKSKKINLFFLVEQEVNKRNLFPNQDV